MIRRRVLSGGLGALLLLPLLGAGTSKSADSPAPEPLSLLRLDTASGETQLVAKGESLPRSAEVIFEVHVTEGDYLYLLQTNSRGLEILLPATGLVWMRPDGPTRVIPLGPNARPGDAAPQAWNSDQSGATEFVLVSAAAPRDVPSDARVASLELFLLPPPYVKGPAAAPARVLARFPVTWLDSDEEPTP